MTLEECLVEHEKDIVSDPHPNEDLFKNQRHKPIYSWTGVVEKITQETLYAKIFDRLENLHSELTFPINMIDSDIVKMLEPESEFYFLKVLNLRNGKEEVKFLPKRRIGNRITDIKTTFKTLFKEYSIQENLK